MYEINFEEDKAFGGVYLTLENNKIYFPNKDMAYEFLIELLKHTGRIGY